MALDLRFDSGFKNLCVEREKVQGRQERGEGKKAEGWALPGVELRNSNTF